VADYFLPDGAGGYRHHREVHDEHAHAHRDLLRWLAAAGLNCLAVAADSAWGAPRARTQRVVYVAGRRGGARR